MRQRDGRRVLGDAIVSSLLLSGFSFCHSAIDDSITSAKGSLVPRERDGKREERENLRDKEGSSCW